MVRMEWRPAGWLVPASVNLPLHHEVQKFSSGTGSPGWSRKKGRKMVVVVVADERANETYLPSLLPSDKTFLPTSILWVPSV